MAAVSPLGRASGVEPRDAPADALTGLYERHASRVFQYCLKWLRSREEAEDAAQTTFLYAYRALDRGVVPTHERPWLLSIARNVCLSRTDAARRRAIEVAQDPHALEETIAAAAPTNELEGLTDALATLTEQQRHAILLREWHGLTYSEIAERLELSQAAVETLLFRARRSLARRLRQPLGIGSFLPWLRSLAEGGVAKIALGAAALAVTATTGAIAIAHQHQARPAVRTHATRSAPATPLIAVVRRQPARKVLFAKQHIAASKPAALPRNDDNTQPPTQPHSDSVAASAPTVTPPAVELAAAAPQTITNSATAATTNTAGTVVDTATTAVAAVTNTVSNTVANTIATAAATAANTVTAAQAAIAAVTTTVTSAVASTVASVVPAITLPRIP